jgi:hypothetical protein
MVLVVALILSYLPLGCYGFNHSAWVGGGIIVDISAPDEVKGGTVVNIEIEIRVPQDVDIQYFNIRIEQSFDTLYAKTLWQNQKLAKDFKYVDLISVQTKSVLFSETLWLYIESKYSDKYGGVYTTSPRFEVCVVRPMTYENLSRAYENLIFNLTRLESKYQSLSYDYNTLQRGYNESLKNYFELYDKYTSLHTNHTMLLDRFETIEKAYYEAESKIRSLESEKGLYASTSAIFIITAIAEGGIILWLRKRVALKVKKASEEKGEARSP